MGGMFLNSTRFTIREANLFGQVPKFVASALFSRLHPANLTRRQHQLARLMGWLHMKPDVTSL